MSSPPVSKHTPLPTSVTLGSPASPQRRSISRGARLAAARPTAWMSGKFCFSRSSPTIDADGRAVLLGERAGRRFELGRAHVVGRRVDEVAGERDAFDDAREFVAVDAVGQREPRPPCRLGLAVAGEAIGAEREGERGEARVVRRIGEAIGAGAAAGRAARRAGTDRCGSSAALEPEQHAGRCRRSAGSIRCRPGCGSKPAASAKARARASSAARTFGQVAAVTNQIGLGRLARAAKTDAWMHRSDVAVRLNHDRWLSRHRP